jgi:DNA gyrase/topoisomerase IV subunit B
MPRGNQTFQKHQREQKLREKARMKRERRQQRQIEKKQQGQAGGTEFSESEPILTETDSADGSEIEEVV